MKAMHRRCAGLDVHQKEIVACRRLAVGRKVQSEVRRFATAAQGLLDLADWLEEGRVTHVAMEATGVYWKPVWHILHGRFTLILANAAHIKGVPGRKSDVNDAAWIAELLAHGLIRPSFVPPQPIQELRDLTRTRQELTREIVRHTQRIQSVLKEANIKLTSVITGITGFSGRRILKAMIAGETDAGRLADLGSSRLAAPREALVAALTGRIRDHHRFLIGQHLKTIEQIEATRGEFDARIEAALGPFRDAVERLKEIPGLSQTTAEIVAAEIGVDMSQFPSADHLVSPCRRHARGMGQDGVQGSTRAPASDDRRASARVRPGSSPYSCNPPSRPAARRTPASRRATTASRPASDPRRPPSRWQPTSCASSTTC